jgi:hypothetical protein
LARRAVKWSTELSRGDGAMIVDRSPATGVVQGSLFATLVAETQSRDLPSSLFATLFDCSRL